MDPITFLIAHDVTRRSLEGAATGRTQPRRRIARLRRAEPRR